MGDESFRQQVHPAFNPRPYFGTFAQFYAVILRHRGGVTLNWNFAAATLIVTQCFQVRWVERLKRQVKCLDVLEREVMIVANARSSGFSVESVSKRFAQREDASAGTRACFENGYVMTEFGEFVSSSETGHSSAANEHLLGRAGCNQTRWSQDSARNCKRATPQELTASNSHFDPCNLIAWSRIRSIRSSVRVWPSGLRSHRGVARASRPPAVAGAIRRALPVDKRPTRRSPRFS